MKIVLQKVKKAACYIDNKLYSEIENGYLLFVGISDLDNQKVIDKLTKKIVNLRINEDENKKMNLSIKEINGEILSISQFTLYANCKKGNRPSFDMASNADIAKPLYNAFNDSLMQLGMNVKTGVFQADMEISLVNDGPITIVLDSDILC